MTPLARRLAPLQVAVALAGMLLWVPVEKLFMSEIGFTAASVGVMAAAYAAVVPLLEVPSGLLADRWSRAGVLVLSTLALATSSFIGWLSHSVTTYVVAALVLGIYFALSSGTVDSIVYDTVLEETGGSDLYELWIGRVRIVESGGFVGSALLGGVLADLTSTRFTYLATVPVVLLAVVGFVRFREPRLHRADEQVSIREQVSLTARSMTGRPEVRRVLVLSAMAAMLAQAVFEFGPLWLVALAAPAVLYGPYWAGLVATFGVGGWLAHRIDLDRSSVAIAVAVTSVGATLLLAVSDELAVVVVAQTAVALLLAVIGIHASKLLHDAVPSSVRTGVASAVGTLSWLVFVPGAVFLGWIARAHGVDAAGWTLTVAGAVVGALLVFATVRRPQAVTEPVVEAVGEPGDIACRTLVDLVSDHLDGVLNPVRRAQVERHLAGCDGCTAYVAQVRETIAALEALGRTGDRAP
jgi:predicted MFS family arabinose efflux permease